MPGWAVALSDPGHVLRREARAGLWVRRGGGEARRGEALTCDMAGSDSLACFECALDGGDQRPSRLRHGDLRVRRGADIRKGELRGWNTADAASGGCPYPRRRGLASLHGYPRGGPGRQLCCPYCAWGREEGSLGHGVDGDIMQARPRVGVGGAPGVTFELECPSRSTEINTLSLP